jgi:hypothetical protein
MLREMFKNALPPSLGSENEPNKTLIGCMQHEEVEGLCCMSPASFWILAWLTLES